MLMGFPGLTINLNHPVYWMTGESRLGSSVMRQLRLLRPIFVDSLAANY
jgi:hypothetical protein